MDDVSDDKTYLCPGLYVGHTERTNKRMNNCGRKRRREKEEYFMLIR
jgi:hypothetical protein